MRIFRVLLLSAAAATLGGCINSATLVKVKPDGSGTVEQTTMVNMQALKAMMPGLPQQGGQPANPVNQDNLKRQAERLGKGVRLLSAEPAKSGGFEGVKAVFAFDDINAVSVSQDPDMAGGTGGIAPPPSQNDNPVRFKLARQGGTSVLTVQFQDKPSKGAGSDTAPAGGPDMSDPTVMNMVKAMFEGFKIGIDLEVVGSIVKTNAEYVAGPRITLLELDVASLLADEAKFKALTSKLGPDPSISELKPYLKDIKGIKIDGPSISVEFR
jgi:hypothetical protein